MRGLQLASFLLLLLPAAACTRETVEKPMPAPRAEAPPRQTESTMTRNPPPAVRKPERDIASSSLVPDPNESPEALSRYQEARQLLAQGEEAKARALLATATARFPDSRHLHQQYAEILWDLSGGRDRALLTQSGQEAARALEIAFRFGKVDYRLTDRLAETLGRTGNRETLDQLFQKALKLDPSAVVYLDYARGLALVDDPRAGDLFYKAAQLQPDGDAMVRYGEWSLDHGQNQEALDRLPRSGPLRYIHFLRGIASERLGRKDEAQQEYAQFREYSATFPAPARFRIPGSRLQAGIHFREAASS
jgi:tetratricopeptide (TPR) repeat protein